jgi:hypothetical protein
MSYPVYTVPAGDVLPILFDTFDGGTGASLTMSGLAATDIEIYKDGGTTQRASDAGYALLDTDGIDFDGITGIHGFSIDTGDNTDSGFYTTGAWFHVVVSAITVDAQAVNFVAAAFRIVAAESSAGVPKADVSHWLGTAAATPTTAGVPEVDTTHWNGTAVTTPPAVNATQISGDSTAADNLENAFDDTAGPVPWLGIIDQGTAQSATATTLVGRAAGAFANDTIIGATLAAFGSTQGYWQLRAITDVDLASDTFTVDTWTVTPSGTITYKIWGSAPASTSLPIAVNVTQVAGSAVTATAGRPEVIVDSTSAGAITTTSFGAGAVDAAALAADAVTEIQSGLATAAALATVDTVVDAIQAKTDQLTFTVANQVDANSESMNGAEVLGDGTAGDLWRG